ncbi:hypothetical protein [Vibrio sp. Vb339]|uniref:hypothetical protein n=1 Tax=Vibrio sp. Vb339 TaxID=1192013 RepID=UPI001551C534|nr:hypothetical protein [Vibrio sp. Vb339]
MRKTAVKLFIAVAVSTTSLQAIAHGSGGTFGGNPGDISKMKELLEPHWNGKPGIQNTSSNGVIVQWKADVCGTFNGKVSDETKCPADSPKMSR